MVITPTRLPMSPAQAAAHAKVSRRTVMRAIEKQELEAFRDNKNQWKIAAESLEKWLAAQCAPSEHNVPKTPTLPTFTDQAERLELAALRAENTQLKQRLEVYETDRDHWRAIAEKLVERRRFFWPWTRSK